MSTKAESTKSAQKTFNSRDPRLRRSEQEPDHVQESRPAIVEDVLSSIPVINKERTLTENDGSLPLPINNSHRFEQTFDRPPEHFIISQPDSELGQNDEIRNVQHMTFVENPVQPITNLAREVSGSPKYGDVHREAKPRHNHRRRNSGDWSSHSAGIENISGEPPVPKMHVGRGKSRKARRRSAERQREKGRGGRGRGHDRKREPVIERFDNDQRFARRVEQTDSRHTVDRPVDSSSFREDWNSDVERRNESFMPHDEPRLRRGKWRRGQTVYVRGSDHDEIVRARSPGIAEKRLRHAAHERDRFENMEHIEPPFSRAEIHQDPEFRMREEKHFLPQEHNPPAFHNDPREQPIGEPLPKKPRPLLSDMEINELRNRKGASPNTGRMTPPPMLQEGFQTHPLDRGELPFPGHADGPFHSNLGPPPHGEFGTHTPPVEHPVEWTPAFEIPRELKLDHENEIMRRVRVSYNFSRGATPPLPQQYTVYHSCIPDKFTALMKLTTTRQRTLPLAKIVFWILHLTRENNHNYVL